MNIRIVCGRLKYKIKGLFNLNIIKKTIYAIKILDLGFNSFWELVFKPKTMKVLKLSEHIIYSDTSLKKIAAIKYIHDDPIILYNEDYSKDSVNCRKIINEYYLKLINGGHNND